MTCTRIPGVIFLSSFLFGSLVAAQEQLPRIAYDVKESVVKVEIHLIETGDHERVSDQLKACFAESDYCVIGTGVLINDDGDVLTAAHVARDTTAVSQALKDIAIDSEVMIAGQARNAEYVKGGVRGDVRNGNGAFRASIKLIDAAHDVAVLGHDRNSPRPGPAAIDDVSMSHRQESRPVQLAAQRPDVAQAVFAFGFPTYSPALITTAGSVVLAAGSKNLVEARKSGDTQLVPVYRAKLDISPGNSGCPMFRSSDGALQGIVSEIGDEREPVATIIPATEIAKVLTANGIRWSAAPLRQASSAGSKSRRKKAKTE
jgi:hypothetical protein